MSAEFELAPGRMIGGNHPCFIIAEIGQNHQGDVNIAKKMIKLAKDAGADCAKFQKSDLSSRFNKAALERPYNSKNSWGKTYGEHKRHLELSEETYRELKLYADSIGIYFTASGWDHKAVDFLDALDVPFIKVASADTNNHALIDHMASKGRPLVISSGMQSMENMKKVYTMMKAKGVNFVICQCTSTYPLPIADVNLNVIQTYRQAFPDIPIGYSGHESGTAITVAAVALGAKVVERHITLDKTWKGSDHAASVDPEELQDLVRQIRTVETALGSGIKRMLPSEAPLLKKLGKSVVAASDIPAGTVLTREMLAAKVAEPFGFTPDKTEQLIGKQVKSNIAFDDTILEDHIVGLLQNGTGNGTGNGAENGAGNGFSHSK